METHPPTNRTIADLNFFSYINTLNVNNIISVYRFILFYPCSVAFIIHIIIHIYACRSCKVVCIHVKTVKKKIIIIIKYKTKRDVLSN